MKRIAEIISWLALGITLVPACLFFVDKFDLDATKMWMLVGAAIWFAATPFWMEHKVN